MAVKEIVRTYLVDENDRVRRLPWRRYARLLKGEERVLRLAGHAVRFAESVYGVEDGSIVYALAHFPLVSFDDNGRRNTAESLIEHAGGSFERCWPEELGADQFHFAESMDALRWEPTETVLKQLEQQIPHLDERDHLHRVRA
jgi:hypothetical protein